MYWSQAGDAEVAGRHRPHGRGAGAAAGWVAVVAGGGGALVAGARQQQRGRWRASRVPWTMSEFHVVLDPFAVTKVRRRSPAAHPMGGFYPCELLERPACATGPALRRR